MKQLSEFDTLEEAKAYSYQDQAVSGDVMIYLTQIGKYSRLKKIAGHPPEEGKEALQSAADACIDTITFKPTLAVNHPDIQAMIAGFVALGEFTQEEADGFLALGPTVFPYKDCTLARFNMNKGVFSESSKTLIKSVISVTANLPEMAQITLWAVKDGRVAKNIGRSEVLESGSVDIYIGDVLNKYPAYEVVARAPFKDLYIGVS